MILEELFTKMYQSVEPFTDKADIVALLSGCTSAWGGDTGSIHGAAEQTQTVTKYLKGKGETDPRNS